MASLGKKSIKWMMNISPGHCMLDVVCNEVTVL